MSFQTWGESNQAAKGELRPNFGDRNFGDLKKENRRVMWRYLEHFFFDPDPKNNGYSSYFQFSGNNVIQHIKAQRVFDVMVSLIQKYKANNYAPHFLNELSQYNACKDFLNLFLTGSEHVVMELLSLYAKSIIDQNSGDISRATNEGEKEYEQRVESTRWRDFDDFSETLNEVFSQFGIGYLLTRTGFAPRVDDKIIESVYDPVLTVLSSPQWKEVSVYLKESFDEYRRRSPSGYSTSVTKAITALQAYLQMLVLGQKGNGNLADLIREGQGKGLIPDDSFSKIIFRNLSSILMTERQNTGDAHPRKEFANEKNSRLVLNLVMVFIQHCLS